MLREVRGIYLTYTLNLRNINSIIYDRAALYYTKTEYDNVITYGTEGTITFRHSLLL